MQHDYIPPCKGSRNEGADMSIEKDIKLKLKNCDLVLVCPNRVIYGIAVFITRLVFPSVEYSPIAPIFGYNNNIYGIDKDKNLAVILIERKYKKACVIFRAVKYKRNRVDDILHAIHVMEAGKLFVRYAITSIFGIILNMLSFVLFYGILGIKDMVALTISIELSIILTFLLNNYWVFAHRKYHRSFWKRFFGYHAVLFVGMIINLGVYYIVSFTNLHYVLSDFVGIIVASVWSMYMVDVHVFFSKAPKNKDALSYLDKL